MTMTDDDKGKSGVREVLESLGNTPTGIVKDEDAVALLAIHLGRVQACNHTDDLEHLVEVRDGARRALKTILNLHTTSAPARSHADGLVNALAPLERLIDRMQSEKPKTGVAPRVEAPVTQAIPLRNDSTVRDRKKISPEELRGFLAGVDFADGEDKAMTATAGALQDMMQKLTEEGKIKHLSSRRELAHAMQVENNAENDDFWFGMLQNNAGRGFTAKDGTIYTATTLPQEGRKATKYDPPEDLTVTNAGAEHDKVHESVHVMSAPGGRTRIIADYGEQLNEGFTEYFAIQMCQKLNVPVVPAYPDEVAFVRKLAANYGASKVYAAYLKNGGFAPILTDLIATWKEKDATLTANKSTQRFAVPKIQGSTNFDEGQAIGKMNNFLKALTSNSTLWNILLP